MSSLRVPYRAGNARGFRYAEIPADVEARLERWLAARDVDDGVAIKATRVYRRGAQVVKFFPPSRALRSAFRALPAVRSADLTARLAPVRTPLPIVAIGLRDGLFAGTSLLVSEFVEGRWLSEVWGKDERAVAAFPAFMASMHRRGIFHGDFHPKNVLWNGREWVLIDLGALRHPLRNLRRRELIEEQWAALDFRLESPPGLRAAFEAYLREADLHWDADEAWRRVQVRTAVMRAHRS